MKYVLILFLNAPIAPTAVSAGPFHNLFACEMAATQAKTLNAQTRSICVNLNARPHHWNGKALPK